MPHKRIETTTQEGMRISDVFNGSSMRVYRRQTVHFCGSAHRAMQESIAGSARNTSRFLATYYAATHFGTLIRLIVTIETHAFQVNCSLKL
jgi:hypothetical protein